MLDLSSRDLPEEQKLRFVYGGWDTQIYRERFGSYGVVTLYNGSLNALRSTRG
jgi:hypothetical protein